MYDTIIIGAGLSGLAAGIRLAYFEKSVCILEKHTTIGGLNSFYRLRGRNHDVGLHAVTNYATPGTKTGPLSKLLRQLRLRWEDFDLSPQLESSIAFPGHLLRFNNDIKFFRSQVTDVFPQQADGFNKLLAHIEQYNELDLEHEPVSGREVVGTFLSDSLLVDMLFCPLMFYGSATPHDMDFAQFVIMFKALFLQGFGRPYEGVRLILKNLTRKYKSLGGELKLRHGVKEILSDNRHATGVMLEDGTILEAKNVLSSAGSAETMRLCNNVPQNETKYQPGDISYVETISVLDQHPATLPHDQTILFYNDSPQFHYENPKEPVDLRSGIICSPNNFDYETPLEEGRIRITALANHRYWLNLSDEEYQQAKERAYQDICDSAVRFMPEFRHCTIDTDTFTPKTIKRFTGHINGTVYGAPNKIRDGRTHLENLYLCGTDQGFLGIIGAMLSGITIANLHLMR
ncbi:Carotenoid cis-trans isomerase [hydrothermal vent metagenome]|uniref:Carotenoid cis-trans isomerase n=1 Tax=hydrothermal vent metagenome TaxID=652676 RepID=A0A3B1DA02_9ZZZZ